MARFVEIQRAHKRVWLVVWLLVLLAVALGGRHFAGGDSTRTQVMGASSTVPQAPIITSGPFGAVTSTSATFTYRSTEKGVQFKCKLDGAAYSSCSKNGVTYSGLAAGSHSFSVVAQQGNGPFSPPDTREWTVIAPPPAPVITARPSNPTIDPDATFDFTDSQPDVTFECRLDGGSFVACTSPKTYEGLAAGSHTFSVRAVSGPATSAATSYTWTVNPGTFGISGDLAADLYPGRTVPLNLVLTNPYNNAHGLDITGVTVKVQHGNVPGCDGPTNVVVASNAPGHDPPWPLNIPRNSTRSLSDLAVPTEQWPQVTMLDLPTNQDACKNTTFHFTYTGTATK